jgi:eukaryotic-like serine/threonine-protein kinase
MGEVYRAHDLRLGRDVAVKVIASDQTPDPSRLRRFEVEARALAALDHPHILAVHDVGTDLGHAYIVCELLEGVTLHDRLAQGCLPVRESVELARQICDALAAAHARGIVHRDLKPQNLFLTGDGRIKVLDFGLAKLSRVVEAGDEDARTPTRTQAGVVLGTLGYMSPEQFRGLPADPRSDVFALGAVLYEMLSGRRAFGRHSHADTLAAVLRSDPPEIETDGVPPGLERVIRRCLEKDPGERFQTAHDLGLALETLSGPTPTPTRRRRTGLRSMVGVITALCVLGAAMVWWFGRRGAERAAGLLRIVPFTADGGYKFAPRLSPDGERVAYSWAGTENDNWDVYVKAIGRGTRPLRLTEHKAPDLGPGVVARRPADRLRARAGGGSGDLHRALARGTGAPADRPQRFGPVTDRLVDILFVSPTVHNMHVDRSAILINTLQPGLVIPQHFGTYREDDENRFWTKGCPDELRLALSTDLQRRCRKLVIGERLVIP